MNKTIFVMASDTQGLHSQHYIKTLGAILGQAEGLQGSAYGIPIRESRKDKEAVSLDELSETIRRFVQFAREHPEMDFEVKNLASKSHFKVKDIAPLFYDIPENVILPTIFLYELFPYCVFEDSQ
jgi:hypothetical protein